MEKNKKSLIDKYSVVIAEFMGYKLINSNGKVWTNPNLNNPLYDLLEKNDEKNLYFHKSYDWLMPVWFKIKKLDFDIELKLKIKERLTNTESETPYDAFIEIGKIIEKLKGIPYLVLQTN